MQWELPVDLLFSGYCTTLFWKLRRYWSEIVDLNRSQFLEVGLTATPGL